MPRYLLQLFLYISLSMFGIGCGTQPEPVDLARIYNRAAQVHDADRNPVIVIPGILGSRLVDKDDGTPVWGSFLGNFADPSTPDGIRQIAHPLVSEGELNDASISIRPDGVLGKLRISLLGLPLELNAYYHVLNALGAGGYRDQELSEAGAVDYGEEHFTCFQFPYDWRRDISHSATQLERFIVEKKRYVEQQLLERYGVSRDVKFTLVAHSMGGLVARYFLRYGAQPLREGFMPQLDWRGTDYVDKLVMVGTPNAGSALAFHDLLHDKDFGPVIPTYPKGVLGSMPAVYQLLPRERHRVYRYSDSEEEDIDIFDPKYWVKYGWGLADPDQDQVLQQLLPEIASAEERKIRAQRHLEKSLRRARQFQQAMDLDSTPPKELSLVLFAGDAIGTKSQVFVNRHTGEAWLDNYQPGDGVVLRSSTLLDERIGGNWQSRLISPIKWSHITFLSAEHLGMTQDPGFINNVLFQLLESPS